MALTIGSLDEKQSRFVLIASGLAVVAIAAIIIWRNMTGASSSATSATSAADSSSATPATLVGVTEDVYAAPGNLTPPTTTPPVNGPPTVVTGVVNPPANPTPVTGITPVTQPTPAPRVTTPAPPTPSRSSAPAPRRTFVVKPWPQPGSSLWSISQIEYGQSTQAHIDALASANHIANPNLIYPGQVLVIP